MGCWWECSVSAAVTPSSTSDVVGQYHKIGSIAFEAFFIDAAFSPLIYVFLEEKKKAKNMNSQSYLKHSLKILKTDVIINCCNYKWNLISGQCIYIVQKRRGNFFPKVLSWDRLKVFSERTDVKNTIFFSLFYLWTLAWSCFLHLSYVLEIFCQLNHLTLTLLVVGWGLFCFREYGQPFQWMKRNLMLHLDQRGVSFWYFL